jgi:hypothetical protein
MNLTTLRIRGADAIQLLMDHRAGYVRTGQYPFLIGDAEELERIEESAEFVSDDSAEIIKASLFTNVNDWIAFERTNAEEYEFSFDETLGEWPRAKPAKGSIGLHKDLLSGKVKPEVFLGLASIEQPWQLPAVLKYGGWNDCPSTTVHCAFYRRWQEKFDAEITGMSGDTVECIVARPPTNQHDAIELAWEQYWYCKDIVEQGCESVANLGATLLDSPYWFFWWD